jgi:hypothetical protein
MRNKMKITTIAAITVLALASPALAQQQHYPMPPGIRALANQHIGLTGYNPYGPTCEPEKPGEHISFDETIHGQWSFFICRNGTFDDCSLSQRVYVGELAATYAAASQPRGYYATNIKPLRLLEGMMQATGTSGEPVE